MRPRLRSRTTNLSFHCRAVVASYVTIVTLTCSRVSPAGSTTQEGNGESSLRRKLALTTPFLSHEAVSPTRVSASNKTLITRWQSRLTRIRRKFVINGEHFFV